MLVDNYRYRRDLEIAWGLAIYVETPWSRILFDTGPNPRVLTENARRLGIDLSKIDAIVVSHAHGDHYGGLKAFAALRRGIPVYIPFNEPWLERYVEELGLEPVVVNQTMEIARGIYVTKPLYGPPWEISLAINTSKGFVVLVGCSHPGVAKIVQLVKETLGGKIYAVLGGMHLAGAPEDVVEAIASKLIELGVEKVYPIHCSGDEIRNVLKNRYPEHYGDGGAGLEIVLELPAELCKHSSSRVSISMAS